jgi:hypothetical protein
MTLFIIKLSMRVQFCFDVGHSIYQIPIRAHLLFRGHFFYFYGSSSAHASQAAQIDSSLNMVALVVVVVVGHDLVET